MNETRPVRPVSCPRRPRRGSARACGCRSGRERARRGHPGPNPGALKQHLNRGGRGTQVEIHSIVQAPLAWHIVTNRMSRDYAEALGADQPARGPLVGFNGSGTGAARMAEVIGRKTVAWTWRAWAWVRLPTRAVEQLRCPKLGHHAEAVGRADRGEGDSGRQPGRLRPGPGRPGDCPAALYGLHQSAQRPGPVACLVLDGVHLALHRNSCSDACRHAESPR